MSETISIIVPTRERVKSLDELLTSLNKTTLHKDKLEICFVIDDDDIPTKNLLDNHEFKDLKIKYTIIPKGKHILGEWWDIGYNKIATGSIIMLCADDFRFRTVSWDTLIYDEFDKSIDKIILVYGDDLFVSKRLQIATYSFVHRKWIENSPFWLPPYFTTDYVDTWISDVADALGRRIFLPNLVIEHQHFLAGKPTPDHEANVKAYHRIMHEKKTEENKKIYFSEEKIKEREKHIEDLRKILQ